MWVDPPELTLSTCHIAPLPTPTGDKPRLGVECCGIVSEYYPKTALERKRVARHAEGSTPLNSGNQVGCGMAGPCGAPE